MNDKTFKRVVIGIAVVACVLGFIFSECCAEVTQEQVQLIGRTLIAYDDVLYKHMKKDNGYGIIFTFHADDTDKYNAHVACNRERVGSSNTVCRITVGTEIDVLFTDDHPSSLAYIVGHELGHIKSTIRYGSHGRRTTAEEQRADVFGITLAHQAGFDITPAETILARLYYAVSQLESDTKQDTLDELEWRLGTVTKTIKKLTKN